MKFVNAHEMKIVNVLMKADEYTIGVLKNRIRKFNDSALERLVAAGIVLKKEKGFANNGKSADTYRLADKNLEYKLEEQVEAKNIETGHPIPNDIKSMIQYATLPKVMQVGDSIFEYDANMASSEAIYALNKYGRSFDAVFDGREESGGVRIWRVS